MTSGENWNQMTLKYCSCLKLALLQLRTWKVMACHIHNILHIITAGKPSLVMHEISQNGYDFNVANHETATVLFAGTASNEIKITVHSVDFFRSYFTKRYNGRTSWFLTVLPQSFSHLGVPVFFELDYHMLAVLFGRRNMVSCEELALSVPLSSGLVLSAVFRLMVWSVLIRIVHI